MERTSAACHHLVGWGSTVHAIKPKQAAILHAFTPGGEEAWRDDQRWTTAPSGSWKAGDFFYVPAGHDSWVVGDESYVSLHILGSED